MWDFILGRPFSLESLAQLKQQCEDVTPDLDDFAEENIDVAAASAQEAAFMVTLLLEFATDNQLSYALRIVRFAHDTIDLKVQVLDNLDPSDPGLNEKIANHPLMISELNLEERDLREIANAISAAGLDRFRESASRWKYGDRRNVS